MKFSIKLGSSPINKELIYVEEDYSFEMWPFDASVEFIKNCIAVVDDTGTLKALWLKPKYE